MCIEVEVLCVLVMIQYSIGSTPIEQQRTSLDLSEVTLLLEPAHSDSETRKKKYINNNNNNYY